MRFVMGFLLLLLLALPLASCYSQTPPAPPSLTVITTEGAGTKVAVQLSGDTAVFDITSPSGIGGAKVQLSSGEWRRTMRLRFHLNGLEEMVLTYGDTAVTLNISSTDSQVRQSVNDAPIDSSSPYWMPVSLKNEDGNADQIPLTNGTIEVTLPPDFHSQNPNSFHIRWIDFYR